MWRAFEEETRSVVLIDEIDKVDIEFPNDLLQELDRMNSMSMSYKSIYKNTAGDHYNL